MTDETSPFLIAAESTANALQELAKACADTLVAEVGAILASIANTFDTMINNRTEDLGDPHVRQQIKHYLEQRAGELDQLQVALADIKAKPQYNDGIDVKVEEEDELS